MPSTIETTAVVKLLTALLVKHRAELRIARWPQGCSCGHNDLTREESKEFEAEHRRDARKDPAACRIEAEAMLRVAEAEATLNL